MFLAIYGCTSNSERQSKHLNSKVSEKTTPVPVPEAKSIDKISNYKSATSAYQNNTFTSTNIGEYVNISMDNITATDINQKLTKEPPAYHHYNPVSTVTKNKSYGFINLVFDNDIFSNTDYYYTNGLTINLVIPALRKSLLNRIFLAPRNYDIEFCGLSITQNIYTPTNPDTDQILYGDRPFSSYLTLGHFRTVYDLSGNIYIKSQLNVGILGPSSFGSQVQTTIHEITPVGWQNQIGNNVILDYHIQAKKGIVNSPSIDINLTARTNIGTLYNKIGGGFELRLGRFIPFYKGPMSVFESGKPAGKLQYWWFLSSTADFIGYDATLQGGVFNNNNLYTISPGQIKRVVLNASTGFAVYYKNFGIEYEQFYLSPEFDGAMHFSWGRIKTVFAF